jgi:hypothetical protein
MLLDGHGNLGVLAVAQLDFADQSKLWLESSCGAPCAAEGWNFLFQFYIEESPFFLRLVRVGKPNKTVFSAAIHAPVSTSFVPVELHSSAGKMTLSIRSLEQPSPVMGFLVVDVDEPSRTPPPIIRVVDVESEDDSEELVPDVQD